ncbi:lytic murein transglycosylase [Nocardioides sp. CFH 31398]|uniref:lytic transglycosylase domain-containing protein n=1 Tax=Nocardioides sp. CFH 31398 TaxID=2919579 RepID=UPI001F07026D|nr:lytic murein transglycosylase [Nocardioides sp. CFH 31398]MCH1865148.1 lytic transglycosylase domain-containing protein [Nocardioides sp. CFH 31398]
MPLALLSAAWTAGLATPTTQLAEVADEVQGQLPDGTEVPTEAIEAPASMSRRGAVAPGVPSGRSAAAVRTASTNGIPAAALAAYQRAETVINRADAGCNISWQLVAAIGRVESDHGRYDGNVLNSAGVAKPGIIGIALDGTNSTARIADTDAGQLDGDRKFDRAVGPMQFIPSTWSVVGVDADGDGQRDPQNINDAALASAVYLCSGNEDLSTTQGQRAAVYRYNNSDEYVDLVLSIMEAYSEGDYSSVPTATASGNTFTPDEDAPQADGPTAPGTTPPGGPTSPGDEGDGGSVEPTDPGTEGPGTPENPGGGDDEGDGGDDGGTTPPPTEPPTEEPEPQPPVRNPTKPVEDLLTYAEARLLCLDILGLRPLDLVAGILNPDAAQNNRDLNACIAREQG